MIPHVEPGRAGRSALDQRQVHMFVEVLRRATGCAAWRAAGRAQEAPGDRLESARHMPTALDDIKCQVEIGAALGLVAGALAIGVGLDGLAADSLIKGLLS